MSRLLIALPAAVLALVLALSPAHELGAETLVASICVEDEGCDEPSINDCLTWDEEEQEWIMHLNKCGTVGCTGDDGGGGGAN